METFDWVPLANPQARYRHQTFRARFGEGYTQAAGAGINSRYDEWPLTFQGSRDMIEDIQDFLDRHQGFRPFRWFPPLGTGAGLYDADEYSISVGPGGCANYTLSVTFRLRKRMYAPTNSAPPVVSGLHQIGQVIAVSQGSWESENPMQFEYQWLRNGEPIAGATGQNYTLVDDDLFDMISVRVTASSLGGSTSVETDPVLARLDSVVSWLYSDIDDTVFVDPAGIVPAIIGDPVGRINDSSGNGNDFTQPTVTARPILGRVPRGGRRNTVSNSTLLGAGYTGTNVTRILDGTGPRGDAVRCTKTNPVGNGSSWYTQVADKAWIPGDLYRTSIAIKNIDATQTRIRFRETSYHVIIDWSDPLASGITPIDGWPDWYLVEITGPAADPSVDNNRRVFIYPQNDTANSGSILLSGLQVEVGEETTPYQLVTNEYDITEAGVEDIHYLSFDLTDDNLTTTLPAIENGTVVIAGTNGIWIDDNYNFDGGTFSIGPTTYTGGPEGILEVIGDPIERGFLVINRQLSQRERDLVIQEMKGRGAPGVFEMGPELWVSPSLGAGWSDNGDGSYTLASDGSYSELRQSDTGTTSDDLLLGRFNYVTTGLMSFRRNGVTTDAGGPTSGPQGVHFTILKGSGRIGIARLTGGVLVDATVSNISLRKLELIP